MTKTTEAGTPVDPNKLADAIRQYDKAVEWKQEAIEDVERAGKYLRHVGQLPADLLGVRHNAIQKLGEVVVATLTGEVS